MSALLDIHSHVVPGVDDGAPDLESALAMIAEMHEGGTRTLWATPHIADELGYAGDPERRRLIAQRFRELAGACPPDLSIRLGCEVTPSLQLLTPSQDVAALALDGLDVVLVDGPDDEPAGHEPLILPFIARVRSEGLRAVLAHPERRAAYGPADAGYGERLAEAGAMLQIDACALLGNEGPAVEAEAWRLLADGIAVLVASDAHEQGEAGDLARAHAAIAERLDAACAERLCCGGALAAGART